MNEEPEIRRDTAPDPSRRASSRSARRSERRSARPAVRRFPGTDLPIGLMLGLVALGLPRTLLEDLGLVAPESSLLYYVLALVPFAVWFAVAVLRRSRRPFLDFLVLGVLYGLSLLIVHQALWSVGPSLGHHPPQGAVDFAERFGPEWHELALRAYTGGIAMLIGVGTGLVAAIFAWCVGVVRTRRTRRARAR